MSLPTLTPSSTLSAVVLPVTGSPTSVNAGCPYKIYSQEGAPLYSSQFCSGASDQVAYVYKKLGGDILDIELTENNVYSAYEEAVLEYSYLINIHQATNILSDALGDTTGSFDADGNLEKGSALSASVGAHGVSLKYTRFDYGMARRTSEAVGADIGLKDSVQFSASFDVVPGVQDYDLQSIISANSDFSSAVEGKKVLVKKVFYKTPHAMWRFYGYYGGLNVVGNLHNYGQFSDDSTFQLIPTWHNKAQALAFEDAIYTRMSHFSYELRDNKVRIFPIPYTGAPHKMFVEFSIPQDAWNKGEIDNSADGVNNMNTLPLGNLPFENINSIGKQWIRRFALALSKETLGQVRSKFSAVPIPGDSVTLNGSDLLSQSKEEQEKLREELKTTLAELTYAKLAETEGAILESVDKTLQKVPNFIFVG